MVRIVRPAIVIGIVGLFAGLLLPRIVSPGDGEGAVLRILVSGPVWFAVALLIGTARELFLKPD